MHIFHFDASMRPLVLLLCTVISDDYRTVVKIGEMQRNPSQEGWPWVGRYVDICCITKRRRTTEQATFWRGCTSWRANSRTGVFVLGKNSAIPMRAMQFVPPMVTFREKYSLNCTPWKAGMQGWWDSQWCQTVWWLPWWTIYCILCSRFKHSDLFSLKQCCKGHRPV